MNTYTKNDVERVRSTFMEHGSILVTAKKLSMPRTTVWGMVHNLRNSKISEIEQRRADRAARVTELVKSGWSDQQIGNEMGLRVTQVKWVRERHNIRSQKPHGNHPKQDDVATARARLENADDAMQRALGASDSFDNYRMKNEGLGAAKRLPRPDGDDPYIRSSMGYAD